MSNSSSFPRIVPPRAAIRTDNWGIQIATTREELEEPRQPIHEVLTIRQLLDKYTVTLGFRNAHLLEILIVLMTTGKVVVEFRTFTERLELCDPARIMTRPATIELFNEYLVSSKEKKVSTGPEVTRRITVQMPKIANVAPRNMPDTPPAAP